MTNILYGKPIIENIIDDYNQLKLDNNKIISIQIGNNEAANRYVNSQIKLFNKFEYLTLETIKYDENISKKDFYKNLNAFNNDSDIVGIIVQKPIPKHLNELELISKIDINKDIEGVNPYNFGKLYANILDKTPIPCTAYAIYQFLIFYHIPIEGKHFVILGRSNIVGKAIAAILINNNATVTICHTKTSKEQLSKIFNSADVIISAVGKAKTITTDMLINNKNTIIIDAGININNNGICGDVDIDVINNNIVKAITPVPGGVGVITPYMLMMNVFKMKGLQ